MCGFFRRIRSLAARLLDIPFLGVALRIAGRTIAGYAHDGCGTFAAAIAFYSILSLIPFVLIVLATLSHFVEPGTPLFREFVDTASRTLAPDIERALGTLNDKRGLFFVVGLGSLLLTAGLVFEAIDTALNRIFPPHTVRNLVLMKLVAALAFLIVASMALVATYLIALSRTWLAARGLSLERAVNDYAAWFHIASMAVIGLLFVATVKYFTGRRVPTRFAFAGGGLFVLLWYAARALINWYLSSIAKTSVIYGSLATLVVLVLWIYYSSCVFLLSAEFVKVLRGEHQLGLGRQGETNGRAPRDC